MRKWMMSLLLGLTPCLAAAGNSVESVNRSSAAHTVQKANQECSSYTYKDICTECCTSYGAQMGYLVDGSCACK